MATSKLQEYTARLLSEYFPEYTIRENYRPEWMVSSSGKHLELDLYIEKLRIAIEVQGKQHYTFVEFFHRNEKGFQERLEDDREKKILCRKHSVRMFEISNENELFEFVKSIRKELRGDYFPQDREEWKATQIIAKRDNELKSKIGAIVHYMYYRFLMTGNLYPVENKILHGFYITHKEYVDKKLNEMFKNPRTERRLEVFDRTKPQQTTGLRTLTKPAKRIS